MKVISTCKTNIYTSNIWVKKVLKINLEIHDIMAPLQKNTHLFSINSNPNVSEKSNVRLLHAAETVSANIDPLDYPHLIKAGSDIHKDLVRQSLMTTETIFTAVALNKVWSMKNHFKRFVLDIGYNEDCISTNHVGLTTLTNIVMPSMLPSCAVLYEEGCRYLNGKKRNKLICSPSHWIIRHHHTTSEKKWKCNHLIDMDYDNIAVIFVNGDMNGSIGLSNCDIVNAVATMRIVKCMKLWAVKYYDNSVMVTECTYDSETWRSIWNIIQMYYDQKIPTQPKSTSEIKRDIIPILEKFAETNTKAMLEVPLMRDVIGQYRIVGKFSAYNILKTPMRSENMEIPYMTFQEICYQLSDLIEEGYNFLRVEASEILAFVATNSDRIIQPGIPPHLPIAYGMRGHSLPMKIMRNMVNDIRNELQKWNISVLCEVYDGQFHQLIVRSENSEPLTRLQMMHDHFNTVMKKYDKKELLEKIMPYSEITEGDRKEIEMNPFVEDTVLELDSVTVRILKQDNVNRFTIMTNEIGGFSLKVFVTYWRKKFNRDKSKQVVINVNDNNRTNVLTAAEMKQLIVGTKFHRRIPGTRYIPDVDSESDSEDSGYNPNYGDDDSESEDTDIDMNLVEESTLTNVSVVSSGQSCMKKILAGLKKLQNKHNWKQHNVNSFLDNYLKSKKSIGKLFLYEMDVINEEVMSFFGKQLFQKKDVKSVWIEKIAMQLRKIPQLFEYSSTEEERNEINPQNLLEIVRNYILKKEYPKDFLAAQLCKINHEEYVTQWENKSTVPVIIYLPFIDKNHVIFIYPEWNVDRNQVEMRTFDYTYILNNLRYHICNKGFDDVATEAFIQVSDMDHDVLPRAVVELKLDRQNCALSQRFFSEDVQKILTRCNYVSEAKFVHLVRNWYKACNERGMAVNDRLTNLYKMYEYLSSLMYMNHYPPMKTHICGIPIRTYEALMQSISTRFTLFHLSSTHSYNARAISTLAVESFFSDLNRFEFSGLGAPKSVDIPKLITHIVHVNTTKHDPKCGLEFTMSTRDNYPCYLLSSNVAFAGQVHFQTHPFDIKKNTYSSQEEETICSV